MKLILSYDAYRWAGPQSVPSQVAQWLADSPPLCLWALLVCALILFIILLRVVFKMGTRKVLLEDAQHLVNEWNAGRNRGYADCLREMAAAGLLPMVPADGLKDRLHTAFGSAPAAHVQAEFDRRAGGETSTAEVQA